jgi:hypothetical protein
MSDQNLDFSQDDEEVLNFDVSDESVEAAAELTAMSYTHQTSAYKKCC